jgi:hypothetical protein
MATAKLYLGNIPVGGDVDADDLASLQTQVDDNTTAVTGLVTSTIPGLEAEIDRLDDKDIELAAEIRANEERIAAVANATVIGQFVLSETNPPSLGKAYVEGFTDWTDATWVMLAKTDASAPNAQSFSYDSVVVGDVIQIGSPSGKGVFIITSIDNSDPVYCAFGVDAMSSSSGHNAGEMLGVTIGSQFDEQEIKILIGNNAASIAVVEGDIQILEGRIDDIDANYFEKGTSTYADAKEIQDAVEANQLALEELAGLEQGAIDQLETEVVRNANMMAPGATAAGVQEIEVTTSMPAYPKETTLYIVRN